ncbi:ABC transporter ATP-binding protein [Acetonema longum]|uniref:Nickel import system ATP-binding protein NikD n=1 Tax=Acetonema longum DSM 6540 TaxID=1009370 RepID=F7NEQ4_9FIRM|nr:ABC transporter ATP-binding protein [Acetonema longum]EGO65465.1 oligopeptide/dipeptide ABC transporter, ATPase subunit [Acetonema longum DSM 6540]
MNPAPGQTPLLDVHDLSVTFRMYDKTLRQHNLQVISELSVTVNQGEILAIAGSSGSGKSLLAHAVLGLLPANATVSGRMLYQGQELTPSRQEQLRGKEIALTPQAVTYLDPLLRVGDQVRGGNKTAAVTAQREAFQRYDLQSEIEAMFPFQLSGGMARRVLVSTAVLSGARLIIADEPTPGLGADIAQDMMNTFRELADSGKSVILITHDIELACAIADRVAIFYGGTTVEVAAAKDFTAGEAALRHPYSKALYRALPQNGFRPLAGFQPYAGNLPTGCLFTARCGLKTPECNKKIPLRELRGGSVRCVHAT